jgi:hypothetical protein
VTGFDQNYGDALLLELRRRVRLDTRPWWRRPRTVVAAGAIVVALGLGGTTAGALAGYIVLPGAPSITTLGTAIVQEHQGSATIDLGTRPSGATDIAFVFTCLSPGTFVFAGGASEICAQSDVPDPASGTFPLTAGQHTTTVTAPAEASWRMSLTYVNSVTTPWAINAHGQSYGVENTSGTPDLISVEATNARDGYVFRTQLADADGTSAAAGFTSPQDALDWQKRMAGKKISVPVYLSDGTTKIGEFVIDYPPSQ